jgi:hypothetical protein
MHSVSIDIKFGLGRNEGAEVRFYLKPDFEERRMVRDEEHRRERVAIPYDIGEDGIIVRWNMLSDRSVSQAHAASAMYAKVVTLAAQ